MIAGRKMTAEEYEAYWLLGVGIWRRADKRDWYCLGCSKFFCRPAWLNTVEFDKRYVLEYDRCSWCGYEILTRRRAKCDTIINSHGQQELHWIEPVWSVILHASSYPREALHCPSMWPL